MPTNVKINTALTIYYCDSDNYKNEYTIILAGAISNEHLQGYLATSREGIIPNQIHPSLEHPAVECGEESFWDPDSDHVWCSIMELDECGDNVDLDSLLTNDDKAIAMSVSDFFKKIIEIENDEGWDVETETIRHLDQD
ncbi:hypothetical protein [Moritella sp. F3]|uniref:hypothetical protein n=1 Tax=Moritella sp. F3 TaxID=2718882 RepID=UPI0018E1A626|nr:hypothetical protein [Moritella sp. F3]GIC77718.1 hypothetical protein FMO001_24450 [Moritella sp. F1]GIC82131.1 hypothetical protein FMO003_24120 [Moritella sp. F3]